LCWFSACSVSHCSDNKIRLRAAGALKRQVDECWLQMPGKRRVSMSKCYHELIIRQAGAAVALGRELAEHHSAKQRPGTFLLFVERTTSAQTAAFVERRVGAFRCGEQR
jgi:hypothetical protein